MKTFQLSTVPFGVRVLLDLLPDEFLDRYQQKGETWRNDKFEIALDTIQLVKIVKSGDFSAFPKYKEKYNEIERPPVSVMDVYETMATAIRHEVSSRTVRYWSDCIKNYTREIVEEFDFLPFDHFVVASHADDPRAALELAVAQMVANNGVLPSSDWLAAHMNRTVSQPELPEYPPDFTSIELQVSDAYEDAEQEREETDPDPRRETTEKIVRLSFLLNAIERRSRELNERVRRGMVSTDPERLTGAISRLEERLRELDEIEAEAF